VDSYHSRKAKVEARHMLVEEDEGHILQVGKVVIEQHDH
jgi:hypothetical protein